MFFTNLLVALMATYGLGLDFKGPVFHASMPSTYRTITNVNFYNCVRTCSKHCICDSMNFHKESGTCELNHHNPQRKLIAKTGFFHYEKIPKCEHIEHQDVKVSYSRKSRTGGTSATFLCKDGFLKQGGSDNATCLSTGEWNQYTKPDCVAICRNISGVGLNVSYSRDGEIIKGTVATMTCKKDFKPNTTVTALCLANGEWENADGLNCSACCSSWDSWEACSKSCGGGMQLRYRQPVEGFDCCTTTSDKRKCKTQTCAYCSSWNSWGGCSVGCGSGTQDRSRHCVGGSNCCPSTSASRPCNTHGCPPSSSSSCFASDSVVRVKLQINGSEQIQRRCMDKLKVGDHVESYDRETSSVTFSEVYFIWHDGDTGNSSRLLKLIVGSDDGKEFSLRLHSKHLVYSCKLKEPIDEMTTWFKADGCRYPPKNPVTAESVKVGDMLWMRNSTGEFLPRVVTEVVEVWSGVRHPLTLNHYIVVDDVLASVHMYHEALYRQLTAPIRFLHGISPSATDTVIVKKLVQIWESIEDRFF